MLLITIFIALICIRLLMRGDGVPMPRALAIGPLPYAA
jgi:hypothetical protein